MKVVVDNNLPRSLADLLTQNGIEATHVLDLGLADASDEILRKRLVNQDIILLSRDDDFWKHSPPNWMVVWIALHNPTLAQLKGSV